MNVSMFITILILSILIFAVPVKIKWHCAFVLQLLTAAITGWAAFNVLINGADVLTLPFITLVGNPISIVIDSLSAFFILVLNFTAITGGLYAYGYLKPYSASKNSTEMSLHYFSFLWLHISMVLACMLRDGLAFLISWEIMAVTSFVLVIFESDKKDIIKIGINYLMQMHVALILIIIAFLYAHVKTGAEFSFDGLVVYFNTYPPFPLFLLFFIGFGIKAGFMPLHTWLPHAHPAAPAHVSGVMSGVMIKLGIYGILRVLTYIHTDLLSIGYFVLVVSLLSGLLGVMYAIVQHDIKKLLAYHSIENIGIIGIGIGIGLIGVAMKIPALSVLGFTGGIAHVLNHSLFKSLLFYTAGSVNQQAHTRNIEQLGGLIKHMPKTAFLFLLGALAICGLPPFNGFISEFLIFSGLFKGLQAGGLTIDLTILGTCITLALIGGLAIFCFTKAFSIVFLGSPRTEAIIHTHEVETNMLIPKILVGLLIVLIGVVPNAFIVPVSKVTALFNGDTSTIIQTNSTLSSVALTSIIFMVLIFALWLMRGLQQKKVNVMVGPTWGCAYTGADPARHQYTATSYSDNYKNIVGVVANVKTHYKTMHEDEVFPEPRKFASHNRDFIEDNLVTHPIHLLTFWMEKSAILQTGKLQHYVLYALVFLIAIFLLTYYTVI
ncbi:MAG: proton-conducting transporter membrane subunit [Chitinophagaceae bacterium]